MAVPCRLVTGVAGERGDVRVAGPLGVRRCRRRRRRARSAGSSASTGGGVSAASATRRAPVVGRAGERVVGDRRAACTRTLACGVDEQAAPSQRVGERARPAARDLVAPGLGEPEWSRVEALGDLRRGLARARRRRARCQDPHAPRRPSRRPEGPSADPAPTAAGARISKAARAATKARVTGNGNTRAPRSERRPSTSLHSAGGHLHPRVGSDRCASSWSRRSCSASSPSARRSRSSTGSRPARRAGGRERDRRPRADDRGAERDPPPPRQARADARGRRGRVARVLIVPCGARGQALARELRAAGTPCAAPRAAPTWPRSPRPAPSPTSATRTGSRR